MTPLRAKILLTFVLAAFSLIMVFAAYTMFSTTLPRPFLGMAMITTIYVVVFGSYFILSGNFRKALQQ